MKKTNLNYMCPDPEEDPTKNDDIENEDESKQAN